MCDLLCVVCLLFLIFVVCSVVVGIRCSSLCCLLLCVMACSCLLLCAVACSCLLCGVCRFTVVHCMMIAISCLAALAFG